MPRGANAKREREYEATEVAPRIVDKQRAQYGETKGEKRTDREGKSADGGLPLDNYRHLTIPQIVSKLNGLSKGDLLKIENYEKSHKNRKGALAEIEKQLKS
jgi:hypothetical protein